MKITATGHAGLRIDTPAGSILCDPWVNPAYLASWFPFPDNSGLDWDQLGDCDYLYISHLHQDHFDPKLLKAHVSKQATVLLPDFPTDQLEVALRDLGFVRFIRTKSNEVTDLGGGLKTMIQALTSPADGPIGDSALWVEHHGIRLLNQNDARPAELSRFAELGPVHAHLLQYSGANWFPMVYELPDTAKTAFGKQKRERSFDRTWRYIAELKATWVFPIAGPPCFLDDELWHLNDLPSTDGSRSSGNTFPDQSVFMREYAAVGGNNGVMLLPGSEAVLSDTSCTTAHQVNDVDAFFRGKHAYLEKYRDSRRAVIESEKSAWSHPEMNVLDEMRKLIEPFLEASVHLVDGVGGPVRLDLVDTSDGSTESVLVDFPNRAVRLYAGERIRYRFSTERRLVEHLIHIGETDWVNSLFLSCRFSAARVGKYNEFIYTFFKCLSHERLQCAEGWYESRRADMEDIVMDRWKFQRRCPHLSADLTRFGLVEDGILTCQLHGWQFDLSDGRCLNSVGHRLRSVSIDAEPQHS